MFTYKTWVDSSLMIIEFSIVKNHSHWYNNTFELLLCTCSYRFAAFCTFSSKPLWIATGLYHFTPETQRIRYVHTQTRVNWWYIWYYYSHLLSWIKDEWWPRTECALASRGLWIEAFRFRFVHYFIQKL